MTMEKKNCAFLFRCTGFERHLNYFWLLTEVATLQNMKCEVLSLHSFFPSLCVVEREIRLYNFYVLATVEVGICPEPAIL